VGYEGGFPLDFLALHELEELFRCRGDAMLLVCLLDGPYRYTELGRALSVVAGLHMNEKVLTRGLPRLIHRGLVAHDADGDRSYRLTSEGTRRAEEIRLVANALEAVRSSTGQR
jgi:DNA-binding HxlR family transcriptional regulator